MRLSLLLIGLIFCFLACQETPAPSEAAATSIPQDTIPRVTGIGGVFFKSADPDKTKEWYRQHLGMNIDQWGAPFAFRNADRPDEMNYLNWDAFTDSTEYFDPSEHDFMINYRVQHIDRLVEQMRADGVTILDSIVSYEYGKFVHVLDADGHKLELWEPVDKVLGQMSREVNK